MAKRASIVKNESDGRGAAGPHSRRGAALVLLCAVFVGWGATPGRAAMLDVGGSGAFSSIQAAVDAARSGDLIRITGGTYCESVNIRKSLTVLGGYDAAHTTRNLTRHPTWVLPRATSQSVQIARANNTWVLTHVAGLTPARGQLLIQGTTLRRIRSAVPVGEDWRVRLDRSDEITTGPVWLFQPQDTVFRIANEPSSLPGMPGGFPLQVRLDGLVIAGGRADPREGAAVDAGGGVCVQGGEQTSFSLTRCELTYNLAVGDGGGAYIELYDSAFCRITSNTLTHNECGGSTEPAGGALALRLARSCELVCAGNRVSENRSLAQSGGLDLEANSGCYLRLTDNWITSNTAQQSGGGLVAHVSLLSALDSARNRIEGNRALTAACGGAYVDVTANSSVSLLDEQIRGNVALLSCGGLGLSIADESQGELAGGEIAQNSAEKWGGMLAVVESASALRLRRLALQSNQATTGDNGGFGLEAREGSSVVATSTTVAANRAAGDGGGGEVLADGGSTATLSRCEFLRNLAQGKCGGARITGHGGSPVSLAGCLFAANEARGDNGALGLAVDTSASLRVSDCAFERNEAGRQNGFGSLLAASQSPVTFAACRFTANRARGGANGVGLFDFREGSSALFENCRFTSNGSTVDAAVGRFNLALGSLGEFAACQFRDNTTSGSGGVGFFHVTDDSTLAFRRAEFAWNAALDGPYGALCVEALFGSLLVFDDTVFEDNLSSGPFGALYASCDDRTAMNLSGCQFRGNRAEGGGYGACAVEAQRDSPVSIRGTTVTENVAAEAHGGFYLAAAQRSPVSLDDCRFQRNLAASGNSGALTIVAEDGSTVSLTTTHCGGNRAYGDAGAVWIKAQAGCPVLVEGCDWSDNIAWHENTESMGLEDAGDGRWRLSPARSGMRSSQPGLTPEPGDLLTQGSQTWAVAEVQTEEISTLVQLRGPGQPRPGTALLRRVLGDAGAFVLEQSGRSSCLFSRVVAARNRAGRDYGGGRLSVSDARDVSVRDCLFSENTSGRMIGGIGFRLSLVEEAVVERNAFVGNRAGWREDVATGGYCGGCDVYGQNTRLLFSGNSLVGNRAWVCGAEGGNWGGGLIDVEEVSSLEFAQNEIRGNQADRDVGGLELGCADQSGARARDNVIAANRAGTDFGGMAVSADSLSPVGIEHNEFRANRAEACGGGLGLRPNGSPEGYILLGNQFTSNTAPVGSAVFVLGTVALQNNTLADNLGGDTSPAARFAGGALAFVTTDGSSFNDTLLDNEGAAVLAIGGDVHCPAVVGRVDPTGRSALIESTSTSLAPLLFCAPHLPLYLVEGLTARRIVEAERAGTAGWFRAQLESGEPLTTGTCEVATEVRWPAMLMHTGETWLLGLVPPPQARGPQPDVRPAPGLRVIQGTVEHFIVEAAAEGSLYAITLDDDVGFGDGEAFLATSPLNPATVLLTRSVISGSEEAVRRIGDAFADIRPGVR